MRAARGRGGRRNRNRAPQEAAALRGRRRHTPARPARPGRRDPDPDPAAGPGTLHPGTSTCEPSLYPRGAEPRARDPAAGRRARTCSAPRAQVVQPARRRFLRWAPALLPPLRARVRPGSARLGPASLCRLAPPSGPAPGRCLRPRGAGRASLGEAPSRAWRGRAMCAAPGTRSPAPCLVSTTLQRQRPAREWPGGHEAEHCAELRVTLVPARAERVGCSRVDSAPSRSQQRPSARGGPGTGPRAAPDHRGTSLSSMKGLAPALPASPGLSTLRTGPSRCPSSRCERQVRPLLGSPSRAPAPCRAVFASPPTAAQVPEPRQRSAGVWRGRRA